MLAKNLKPGNVFYYNNNLYLRTAEENNYSLFIWGSHIHARSMDGVTAGNATNIPIDAEVRLCNVSVIED